MARVDANANHLTAPNCNVQTLLTGTEDAVDENPLEGPIKLLSWNIQKAQTEGWDADLKAIAIDRDLVLIQEASNHAKAQHLLPQPMHEAFAAGYSTESEVTGVLTLSVVSPSAQCDLTSWEPWLGTPKATSVTTYPVAGSDQTLLVINLHAVNFTVGLEDFMTQIDALAPILAEHKGPTLLAGDLNTWSEARQNYVEGFMEAHKLRAVTFAPDHRSTFWDMPLDHIYLRGLRALEAQAIAVSTSDHNPLLVTLEFEQPQPNSLP